MAWLPMYLLQEDVSLLNQLLNQADELAFLVKNGSGKWKATATHDISQDLTDRGSAEYALWHIPAGALPLIQPQEGFVLGEIIVPPRIPDPWQGWPGLVTSSNSSVPYFGAGTSTAVINVTIQLPRRETIELSGFSWVGNYFRETGYPAHPATELYWQRLRKLLRKEATPVPRANEPTLKREVYAFPAAYKAIQDGQSCRR